MTIAFIGVGNYTGRLLRGLFGDCWGEREDDFSVNLFDIDCCRLDYVAKQLLKVNVSRTLVSAIKDAEVIIVGVPVARVRGVVADIKKVLLGRSVSLIIMDGANPTDIVAVCPDFFVGAIMFNHFVRTRSGVVGFWPGTLRNDVVLRLSGLLSRLGMFKMVDSPNELKVIRVIAGVGSGVLLQFLYNLVECFVQFGITGKEADRVVRSLLDGTVTCYNEATTIQKVYEEIKGNRGLVTAETLQKLDVEVYNKMIIKNGLSNALKKIEEVAVL